VNGTTSQAPFAAKKAASSSETAASEPNQQPSCRGDIAQLRFITHWCVSWSAA